MIFDKHYGLAYVEEIVMISAKYLSKIAAGDKGKFLYWATVKDTETDISEKHHDGHFTFTFAAAKEVQN